MVTRMLVGAAAALLIAGGAAAQDATEGEAGAAPAPLSIELNKMVDVDGACRLYVVLHNETGRSFTELKLDIVLFDAQSIILDQILVDLAPLARDRTMVRAFEIAGHACSDFGEVLMNDVLACAGAEETWVDCVDAIVPSTRAQIDFTK